MLFLIFSLAVVILLITTSRALYNIYLHPLSAYPGPASWTSTHIAWALSSIRGDLYLRLAALHEIYGPIVRIAPNYLSYTASDASTWKDIYGLRPENLPEGELAKTKLFRGDRGGIQGITQIDTRAGHARIRGAFAHRGIFDGRGVREQEGRISEIAGRLVKKLKKRDEEKVDLQKWIVMAIFDLMGVLTFGEEVGDFGGLRKGELCRWVQIVNDFSSANTVMAMCRLFSPLNKLLLSMVPRSVSQIRIWHRDFTIEKVARRMKLQGKEKDMKPDLLTNPIQTLNTPNGLTLPELQVTAETFVLAGAETTASLLSGALFLLLRNPSTLSLLVTEIRFAFSSPSSISLAEVNHLTYLNAVIEESLRIFPPVSGTTNRVTPQDHGVVIAGKYVPPTTYVGVSHWATCRSAQNFVDPERFLPERWLDEKHRDERFSADRRGAMQAFGFGPRNCIGRSFAYAEAKIFLARLLWEFDLVLCEESQHWISGQKVFMIWEKKPLWVRLKSVNRSIRKEAGL